MELPFDADLAVVDVFRFEADEFSPSYSGMALESQCDEFVVAA